MKEITLLVFVTFLLLLCSCNDKKEDAAGENNESKITSKSEDGSAKEKVFDSDIQKKEEQNKSTDQIKEDEEKTNELGMTAGMPANFPSDVPQPLNSKVIGSLTSSDGTMVTFESKDKVQDIVNFYKEEMKKNGYEIAADGELITPDKGGLINWKKKGSEVQLVLGYDKDKNISSLVITYK